MIASHEYLGPIAERTHRIAPFEVMEFGKIATELAEAGHPVIALNIGEPDFTAAPRVIEAMKRAAEAGRTQYTAALGIEPLRRAIAAHYRREQGLDVDPARIVVTAGASAALTLLCAAIVEHGSGVLMADPCYPCNRHFVAAAGGFAQLMPVDADTRFQPTVEDIDAHWSDSRSLPTRGVLLASPANPTGTSIPFDTLRTIVERVRERRGFTIVDEIYLDLSYGSPDAPIQRRRSALELGDDVIVVNSFSKFFNMTGWRLGWIVAPPALVPVLERLAQNLYICASTPAQHAAVACFDEESLALFEQRREAFRERRDWLIPALAQAGLPCPVFPDGAFYAWTDCSAHGLDSRTYAHRLLREQHVAIVPGHDFGARAPERFLRISYAASLPMLKEAVARISRFNDGLKD